MSTELEKLGVTLYQGYKPENLSIKPDLVIVGNAVSKDNPEVVEMLKLGLKYMSMPQALGEIFMPGKKSIVVAGTHGKTTTTALLAHVLIELGTDPSYLVGGILQGGEKNYHLGQGDYFVIEGDEYDTAFFDKGSKFLHYRPYYTLITSLEFDHADIFRDLDHMAESFRKLINITQGPILLSANRYPKLSDLHDEADNAGKNVSTYDIDNPVDWSATRISYLPEKTIFDVEEVNQSVEKKFWKVATVESPLAGEHNVLNTLAVFAICARLGLKKISHEDIAKAISTFPGVKRRQEVRGVAGGVTVIDDFAHHPTAVAETIKAIKNKYPNQKIWAIFEPRSNSSKRDIFQKAYELCFSEADHVILSDVFMPEKVKDGKILNVDKIIEHIQIAGKSAQHFSGIDKIVDEVKKSIQPNTVLLVMSNGGFGGIHEKLLNELKKIHAPF